MQVEQSSLFHFKVNFKYLILASFKSRNKSQFSQSPYPLYSQPPFYKHTMEAEQPLTQQLQPSKENYFNMFSSTKPEQYFIKTISKQLNDFLQGGLHKGLIAQLYGQAGCGKTHLAILSTLGAISRSIPTCYLATQKQLNWNRFTSLAYNFMNEAELQQQEKMLIYKKTSDFSQGYNFIEESLKKIKANGKGGLLVIDSIYGFIMSCLQFHNIENDVFQKSRKQAEIVNRIRWLAKMAGVAVLFINHAADVVDKRRGSSGRSIVPTLGQAWQLNIDQNIYLTRKGDIREVSIINSPKCKKSQKRRFRIQQSGFIWISEDGVQYIE